MNYSIEELIKEIENTLLEIQAMKNKLYKFATYPFLDDYVRCIYQSLKELDNIYINLQYELLARGDDNGR